MWLVRRRGLGRLLVEGVSRWVQVDSGVKQALQPDVGPVVGSVENGVDDLRATV